MNTLILVVSILAADNGSPSAQAAPSASAPMAATATRDAVEPSANEPPRPVLEVQRAVSAALRGEALASSNPQRVDAVKQLISLYDSIRRDARLESSSTLQSSLTNLHIRLTRVRDEIEREQKYAIKAGSSRSASHAGARGGRAFNRDDGQALVELIQRTIDPSFWDVNGGPGTIVYFAPKQVLVVRGTSEVHHSVGSVLGNLRKN